MNSGYSGYSMSNRAAEAYNDGRKPLTTFDKYDVECFNDKLQDRGIKVKVKSLAAFKRLVKRYGYTGEYHHTSAYCNATDFYDPDSVLDRNDNDLIYAINYCNEAPKKKIGVNRYKGDFTYIIWTGTRQHPKANEQYLSNVIVEEKRKTYYVYDNNNHLIVKKQKYSNGTHLYIKEKLS